MMNICLSRVCERKSSNKRYINPCYTNKTVMCLGCILHNANAAISLARNNVIPLLIGHPVHSLLHDEQFRDKDLVYDPLE